jgi:DNA-binding response OmpR family regulator
MSQPITSARRVLLVEEDPAARAVVRDVLARLGWDVIDAAEDAASAVLARERVNLAVLALGAPGAGGQPFLDEVRRVRPDLPVLVLAEGGEGRREPA